MIRLTAGEVAEIVGGRLAGDIDPTEVVPGPVVVDSRAVVPGSLFVALPGSTVDGHAFIAAARHSGAVLALTTRDVDGPAVVVDDTLAALGRLAAGVLGRIPDLIVVGVTGSTGKTSTKDLLAEVLTQHATTVAAPASYNGEIGLPLAVLGSDERTRLLVLEYGARGLGHIAGLAAIARPDIAVVLNVGLAHIGVFGDVDAVAAAKGELVEALAADGVAILNLDDPVVASMPSRTAARVVTFGRTEKADVRATEVVLDADGRACFRLVTATAQAPVRLRLFGEHHVGNALAAAAVAVEVGLDLDVVARTLSMAEPRSRWRMEVVTTDGGVTVINDAYNANPASMAAGLRALVAIGRDRRTWAVLGPMAELGAHTDEAHRAIGALAAELGVGRVVTVGSDAAVITAAADRAGVPVQHADDVDAALSLLRAELRAGDVVLVKASRSAGLERVATALVEGPVRA